MRKFALLVMCLSLLVTACQAAATVQPTDTPTLTPVPPTETPIPPTATPIPPTPTPEPPILTISGPDGSKSLTLTDLTALPASEGQAGIKSSTGKITPPQLFTGVSLKDLALQYGEFTEQMGVNLIAEDGYAITYSYDQIMNGSFIAYDPATGEELKTPVELTAIVAYARDGQPLNEKEDGKLRAAIISAKNNQVTDGHWSVKWVDTIEIKSLVQDWTLQLSGVITATIDRASFESCASCHRTSWKDDKAQEWTGVPLWMLAGYVDDEIKHEGISFNANLYKSSFPINLIAADGYTASLDSSRIVRNNELDHRQYCQW